MVVKTPSKLLKQLLRYKDLKIWTTIILLSHVEHWLVVNVADDDVINISLPVSNTWLHCTWLQVHAVLRSVHSLPSGRQLVIQTVYTRHVVYTPCRITCRCMQANNVTSLRRHVNFNWSPPQRPCWPAKPKPSSIADEHGHKLLNGGQETKRRN